VGRAPKDVQVLFVNQIPALKPVAKIMMFQESQSKSKITRMLEQLNNVKVLKKKQVYDRPELIEA
jgi:hypothetical protein